MPDKTTMEGRDFLEHSTVGIVHATPEGQILRCNTEFASIIGYAREEVRGLSFQEITSEEDGASCLEAFRRLWSGASDAASLEIRLNKKNGEPVWTRLTVSLLRDREGWPSHLLGHAVAIRERTIPGHVSVAPRVETEMPRDDRYRSAFDTCPDGVLITQVIDGKILDANPALLEMLGYDREEIVARKSIELDLWADDSDRVKLAEALDELSGFRDLEIRLRRKSGEVF